MQREQLLFVSAVALIAVAGAVPTRQSFGLMNLHNPVELVNHGHHCAEVLQEYRKMPVGAFNELRLMHKTHCQQTVRNMLLFVLSTPDYSVDTVACEQVTSMDRACQGECLHGRALYDQTVVDNKFGEILLKEYRNEPLTTAEATYIRNMNGPFVTEMHVLGVYCKLGRDRLKMTEMFETVLH